MWPPPPATDLPYGILAGVKSRSALECHVSNVRRSAALLTKSRSAQETRRFLHLILRIAVKSGYARVCFPRFSAEKQPDRSRPVADISVPLHSPRMSYRPQMNWGVLVACLIAVPLALAWTVIVFFGGTLACVDAAAHCDGIQWPLVEGISVIAAAAAALALGINRVIAVLMRRR
jgi:hypothetical protein